MPGRGGGSAKASAKFSNEQLGVSEDTVEVEGVVEVPHFQERLSFFQKPGFGNGGDEVQLGSQGRKGQAIRFGAASAAADSTESSQQGPSSKCRTAIRVRSRTRGSGEVCVGNVGEVLRGRESAPRGQGGTNRTALSPVPVCPWGVRFASRHQLRSVKASADSTESSSQGHDVMSSSSVGQSPVQRVPDQPGIRCDDLTGGFLEKKVEVVHQVGRKVTVCEEFPARCPRKVMYACLTLEFQNLLYGRQNCEVATEEVSDPELDPLCYTVPEAMQHLRRCESSPAEEGVSYSLECVGWEMFEVGAEVSEALAAEHKVRCGLLEVTGDDVEGWLKGCEKDLIQDIQELEGELRRLQYCEQKALQRLVAKSGECFGRQGPQRIAVCLQSQDEESGQAEHSGKNTVHGNVTVDTSGDGNDDPPPLQTKTIAQEQVRRELAKWREPMGEEVESLVTKTGAVEDLTDRQYKDLIDDAAVSVELIPGKMVYVHKSTGRRRARMVGCGNFCEHDSNSQRADLFASGAGAESIRMMIRKCSMEPSWHLVSVDVKTAFLQAPLMEMQKDGKVKITVVRVPSILREAGVTTARYWKVKKALYGLSSAPRSWSNHRDRVMTDLRIGHGDGFLKLQKLKEDANLWHVLKFPGPSASSDKIAPVREFQDAECVGVVALYVDDILVSSTKEIAQSVVQGLESQWELSAPDWLSAEGDCLKFAGFELQKTSQGIRLHQEGYTRDLLEQYQELIPGVERAPAVKMSECEAPKDYAEQRELTRKAQSLIGQLLWLSGRTRPDLAYAVNYAAQRIVPSPREAVLRAEHIVRYLRQVPDVGLHYKPPSNRCGRWDQLKFRESGNSLEAYSDASFAADEKSRSYGCIKLFWGGALIFWASCRQTLIAAHTAECELYSLGEAHLLGKAMRPTVAALMGIQEADVNCSLYCDNAAAIQLCTLETGSWRTRHLRLRGAVVRQDLEEGLWRLSHLDGVFMPADLGTKPVGPARLEDLIRVCDLWAPHLVEQLDPPRPQVASMQGPPTNVAKALLALILVIQMAGARAAEVQGPPVVSVSFVSSLITGFGLGIGWWVASRLGSFVERCFRGRPVYYQSVQGRPVSVSVESARVQESDTRVDVEVQTELIHHVEGLELGESETDPFPVQSEGLESLVDGMTVDGLQRLYDQLYHEQVVENQALASSGSGDNHRVEIGPCSSAAEETGSHEVWYLRGAEENDMVQAILRVQVEDSQLLEERRRPPPDQMLAEARAPTVPGPPPYVGLPRDRFQNVDDEGALIHQPAEDGEDEQSSDVSSDEHSTIGQWTTDSGMPRGHSSGSVGTSLAAVSLATSVHSAVGYREVEESGDGSWELGILLVLVAAVCSLTGALCACAWLKFRGCERGPEGSTTSSLQGTSEGPSRFSPVVNVTVRSQISGFPGELKTDVETEAQGTPEKRQAKIPVGPPKGLVPDSRENAEQRSKKRAVGVAMPRSQ